MRLSSYERSTIEGVAIVIECGDLFYRIAFKNCCIDDVSGAPFKNTIFESCYFDNCTFASGLERDGLCQPNIHSESFIENVKTNPSQ